MTKRGWSIVLAVFLVAIAIFFAQVVSGPTEPSYKGRALSQWVEDISPGVIVVVNRRIQPTAPGGVISTASTIAWNASRLTNALPAKHQAATAALRAMGTYAIPHLLRTIYSRDGKLKATSIKWSRKQKLVKLPFQTAEEKQQQALPALSELGSSAIWAWVEVVTNDLSSQGAQAYAGAQLAGLRSAATPALPAMLWMQDHPHPSVQVSIRHAIQYCDKDGLLGALHNVRYSKDQGTRASAAWSIGFIGQHPDMSVPVLAMALKDSNALVRENAVEALGKFGTNALSASNAIRALTNDPARGVRRAVTNALNQLLGNELTK